MTITHAKEWRDIYLDMEIVIETDDDGNRLDEADRSGVTETRTLPHITDAAGLIEAGWCTDVYYAAYVGGFPVDWLKVRKDKLVLSEPEDPSAKPYHASLKIMYPADLVGKSGF